MIRDFCYFLVGLAGLSLAVHLLLSLQLFSNNETLFIDNYTEWNGP